MCISSAREMTRNDPVSFKLGHTFSFDFLRVSIIDEHRPGRRHSAAYRMMRIQRKVFLKKAADGEQANYSQNSFTAPMP